MTRRQRNRQTWKKWQRLVSEQTACGQTISVFCREGGLGRQSFFAWRKRLSEAKPKNFVEVKVATVAAEPARSVEAPSGPSAWPSSEKLGNRSQPAPMQSASGPKVATRAPALRKHSNIRKAKSPALGLGYWFAASR